MFFNLKFQALEIHRRKALFNFRHLKQERNIDWMMKLLVFLDLHKSNLNYNFIIWYCITSLQKYDYEYRVLFKVGTFFCSYCHIQDTPNECLRCRLPFRTCSSRWWPCLRPCKVYWRGHLGLVHWGQKCICCNPWPQIPCHSLFWRNCWQQKWWLFWHRALKGYLPMLFSLNDKDQI